MSRKRAKGRPSLPPSKVRKLSVHVTVTVDEHRRIKRAAEAEDLSMSAWVRRLIHEASPQ